MQAQPGRSADLTDRPRFRQDLFAEAVDEHGTRFIDVMDPDSGSVFRFYEVEYSLACGMDGERDVAGIVKWAQDELGLSPSQQEVRTVIATLGDLGFIAGADSADVAASADDTGPHAVARPEPAELPAPELARSVVVGAPAKVTPAPDLELGAAGTTSAPKREAARPAPALELGAPGATAAGGRRAAEPTEDIGFGASGARAAGRSTAAAPSPEPRPERIAPRVEARPEARIEARPEARIEARPEARPEARIDRVDEDDDVSLDLSDHIAVRPDDVKEAVRASKVMSVVEAPRDLDKPAVRPPAPVTRAPEAERQVRAEPPFARPPAVMAPLPEPTKTTWPPEPRAAQRPAVELPRPPLPAAPMEPAAEAKPTSSLPVVLLIIALLVAAAVLVWKYVVDRHDAEVQIPVAVVPPVAVAPPPPPPPAPSPTSKIELETPQATEIKTGRAGVIETILGDKTTVKEGDVVAKFVGDKPIEAERSALVRDQKRLQDQIEAISKRLANAQTAGNKSAENAAQAELATKQGQLATKQGLYATKTADLERFMLYAPGAGSFAPQIKQGQKVAADATIGKLQRESTPVVRFKITDAKPFALQSAVELSVGKDGMHVNCTVADIQPDSVKVTCPAEPSLTEGSDVTLKVPGAPTPIAPEPAATGTGAAAPAADSPGSAN